MVHRSISTLFFIIATVGVCWTAAHAEEHAFKKLVLIGDSTVKNGQGRGDGGLWGWGQVLQPHFKAETLHVENRALGGRSSRTYLTEGLWKRSLDALRPGDYLMIQFGHNDGGKMFESTRPRASIKGNGDESIDGVVEATGTAETVHSYGWYLRKYIADAKEKGVIPIVLSPVPRNIWRDGRVARASNDYGKWAREAAEQADALFIDLNEIVSVRYEQEGQPRVANDFFTDTDHTHTTRAGALVNAECVVAGLRDLEGCDLADHLREEPVAAPQAFDFGSGEATVVTAETYFTPEAGYGFEPGANVRCQDTGSAACCVGEGPFSFSIAVPEGNHLVEVTLGSPTQSASTAVEAELRRDQLGPVATEAGQYAVRRFLVNTRTPTLESGGTVRLKARETTSESAAWDDKLTLRFVGKRPAVARVVVRPAPDSPTVYILGDSTVADQPVAPWAGWGQKLPRWFGDRIAVANHSESGESVRGSYAARRFAKVFELLRPDDWLLIQFGHNDMKDKSEDALDRYRDGLRRAIVEAGRCGARVVLITSMERCSGVESNTLGPYPQAVRDLAAKTGTPLVDLQLASQQRYRELGDRLEEAFQDTTHTNGIGAAMIAELVLEGLGEATPELAAYAELN